jgi:hypothetical protein
MGAAHPARRELEIQMKIVMQGMMVQYLLNLEGEVVLAGNKPVPARSIMQRFVCKTMKPEVVK